MSTNNDDYLTACQVERSLPLLVALRKDDQSTVPIGETLVRPHAGCAGPEGGSVASPKTLRSQRELLPTTVPAATADYLGGI
jgi:hypothetical protein